MGNKERDKRKSDLLGMPHGTAAHRLRKLILFDLLKRHDEANCFKCGEIIQTADELSIEHKQPWENVDANLFWDLDNIAFSHMRCNRPDRPSGPKIGTPNVAARKVGPKGTAWCSPCQVFKSTDEFRTDSRRWNGLRSVCKECDREYNTAYQRKRRAVA